MNRPFSIATLDAKIDALTVELDALRDPKTQMIEPYSIGKELRERKLDLVRLRWRLILTTSEFAREYVKRRKNASPSRATTAG